MFSGVSNVASSGVISGIIDFQKPKVCSECGWLDSDPLHLPEPECSAECLTGKNSHRRHASMDAGPDPVHHEFRGGNGIQVIRQEP